MFFFPAALFINLLFISAENPPWFLSLSLSLGASLSLAVTYNYSADLPPASITSALQRSCWSVEESIVGVPGGFLDNELAVESFSNG